MLETIDLNVSLPKEETRKTLEELDIRLGLLQRELRDKGIPSIIIMEGWDAAGKGTAINRFLRPLDPRGFQVHATRSPTAEEAYHPPMWRFWQRLPKQGAIAVFDKSWYVHVLEDRVEENKSTDEWKLAYERIRTFERQLVDDGAVILKFWMHISKKEQAKRFQELENDNALSWRVTKEDRRRHKKYNEYYQAVEDMLVETSTANAPWTVIPAHDRRYAHVRIAETIAAAFEQALARPAPLPAPAAKIPKRRVSPLDRADLTRSIAREEYDKTIPSLQDEMRQLEHLLYGQRVPAIILYEGWDASGKGGNIKRLTRELDPRGYEVVPVAAPAGDEKVHHYLWRFWKAIPKAGHIAIFDRSWYGRVLVERVEGFATPQEWQRAYREINEFEQELVSYGTVLVKFWIHISPEEQLARFNERQNTPYKQWKITDEDWRNREKWGAYWDAVSEMIEKTSTTFAPWTIIEGNDKLYARIKTHRAVIEALSSRLKK